MAEINVPFTDDEVVGVAPAGTRADLLAALRAAEFDFEVLEGPTDADKIDVDGEGLASKIYRFFQQGEERKALERFQNRLMAGDDVVRIVGAGDRADEAGKVFADHGGETVWHYGRWTYRKLHHG